MEKGLKMTESRISYEPLELAVTELSSLAGKLNVNDIDLFVTMIEKSLVEIKKIKQKKIKQKKIHR